MVIRPFAKIINVINLFIQYIRKHNRRKNVFASIILRFLSQNNINNVDSDYNGDKSIFETLYWKTNSFRKFFFNLIINLNETLLLFEFLNGYFYNFKRIYIMAGKLDRNSWDKR